MIAAGQFQSESGLTAIFRFWNNVAIIVHNFNCHSLNAQFPGFFPGAFPIVGIEQDGTTAVAVEKTFDCVHFRDLDALLCGFYPLTSV
jgi:hypothetical protein